METKICKKCGRELPIEAFAKGRSECKECTQAYQREWQRKRREEKKAAKMAVEVERSLPSDKASSAVIMSFLKKVSPRLLIKALYEKGYKGEMTYTVTHKIDIEKIGKDTDGEIY